MVLQEGEEGVGRAEGVGLGEEFAGEGVEYCGIVAEDFDVEHVLQDTVST